MDDSWMLYRVSVDEMARMFVLGVDHQVMCLEHGQGERMKPKKPEQGALGDHGYVDQQVTILTVEKQRGFYLEQIRVVLDQ